MIEKLRELQNNSYSPYSHYKVSAIAVMKDGREFVGVNVENASYGATICAERVAVVKAVSEGENKILAIAVYTPSASLAFPCGMCLQVLSEFAEDIPVILADEGGMKTYRLYELLPHRFGEQ